jgi:hypothetical protein
VLVRLRWVLVRLRWVLVRPPGAHRPEELWREQVPVLPPVRVLLVLPPVPVLVLLVLQPVLSSGHKQPPSKANTNQLSRTRIGC